MHITLLGTGCPAVHLERYGPAQLIRQGATQVLVDCGSGVTQRLLAAGSSGREIDALLLTHLHSDHIVDLFQLVISSWHQGRDRPQRLYGPPGTRAYVEGLLDLWRPELALRMAHEKRPSAVALEVEVEEIAGGDTLVIGEVSVRVVPVEHEPVRYAFGFIFQHASGAGPRIALSGDTRRCEALIEAAHGVELLVHEVFVHREMPVVAGLRSAETVARVASYHTLSNEVGKIATEAEAACLMLTHFVPPGCDRDTLLAEVSADFAGPVLIGEDLMSFDAGTRRLRHAGGVISLGRPRPMNP